MYQKQITSMFGWALVLGLAMVAPQSCGSDSSNNNGSGADLCNQACDKIVMCVGDAGVNAGSCKQSCTTNSNSQNCTNSSAILSAAQDCLKIADCGAFETCIAGLPDCQHGSSTSTGSTGAAGGGSTSTTSTGSTGAGGSGAGGSGTGTGGSGGGATCDVCVKADLCCAAFQDGSVSCVAAQACNAATDAQRDQVIAECQLVLMTLGSVPNAPAACK